MNGILAFLISNGPQILSTVQTIAAGVGAASAACAWLPKGQPGTAYGVFRGLLDLIGQNYGNAKNHPGPGYVPPK
jgi:hypothetical protein